MFFYGDIRKYSRIITSYFLKAPYSLKIGILSSKKVWINAVIYGINTIIKCGTWQPVKFQLVSRSWNEMISSYLRIFYLR